MRRTTIVFAMVILAPFILLNRTQAAGPIFVMVYGNLLSKPIIIDAGNEKLFERQGLVSIDGKVVDVSYTDDFALEATGSIET
jgi:hypothetical protein